jgi:hypothetical protein
MLGRLCLLRLEYGITMHECINQDFATNTRELTFAKTQQKCKHGKAKSFHSYLALGGV